MNEKALRTKEILKNTPEGLGEVISFDFYKNKGIITKLVKRKVKKASKELKNVRGV